MWFFQKKKPKPTREDYIRARAVAIDCERFVDKLRQRYVAEDPMAEAIHDCQIHEADRAAREARYAAHRIGIDAGIIEEVCW